MQRKMNGILSRGVGVDVFQTALQYAVAVYHMLNTLFTPTQRRLTTVESGIYDPIVRCVEKSIVKHEQIRSGAIRTAARDSPPSTLHILNSIMSGFGFDPPEEERGYPARQSWNGEQLFRNLTDPFAIVPGFDEQLAMADQWTVQDDPALPEPGFSFDPGPGEYAFALEAEEATPQQAAFSTTGTGTIPDELVPERFAMLEQVGSYQEPIPREPEELTFIGDEEQTRQSEEQQELRYVQRFGEQGDLGILIPANSPAADEYAAANPMDLYYQDSEVEFGSQSCRCQSMDISFLPMNRAGNSRYCPNCGRVYPCH